MSDWSRLLLDELASDEAALDRLASLLADRIAAQPTEPTPPAYTVRTLAQELGRKEGWIRAAIARGELAAAKRGRGYIISAEAVAEWARAPARRTPTPSAHSAPRRARRGARPATEALRSLGL